MVLGWGPRALGDVGWSEWLPGEVPLHQAKAAGSQGARKPSWGYREMVSSRGQQAAQLGQGTLQGWESAVCLCPRFDDYFTFLFVTLLCVHRLHICVAPKLEIMFKVLQREVSPCTLAHRPLPLSCFVSTQKLLMFPSRVS